MKFITYEIGVLTQRSYDTRVTSQLEYLGLALKEDQPDSGGDQECFGAIHREGRHADVWRVRKVIRRP